MEQVFIQGDVVVKVVKKSEIPTTAIQTERRELAFGETSGHAHYIDDECDVLQDPNNPDRLFFSRKDFEIQLQHMKKINGIKTWTEEHHAVVLPKLAEDEVYVSSIQREYDPFEDTIVNVSD
jgi:hypothetical protein